MLEIATKGEECHQGRRLPPRLEVATSKHRLLLSNLIHWEPRGRVAQSISGVILTRYWLYLVTSGCYRGNLVKSVIHVSRGHWKTKIPKCWKSYCFGYLVPVYTASDEKKTTGHLIAPFTNLLCLIQRIPMSPRDAYFLYHVFMLQVTCILHKSVVIDAIKIEFVYVRLSNGIVVFIYIMSQE